MGRSYYEHVCGFGYDWPAFIHFGPHSSTTEPVIKHGITARTRMDIELAHKHRRLAAARGNQRIQHTLKPSAETRHSEQKLTNTPQAHTYTADDHASDWKLTNAAQLPGTSAGLALNTVQRSENKCSAFRRLGQCSDLNAV